MSLQLLYPVSNYDDFLSRENGDDGICFGISLNWIIKLINSDGANVLPPDSDIELKESTLFQREIYNRHSGILDKDRLKWAGKKIKDSFHGIKYKIKGNNIGLLEFDSCEKSKAKLKSYVSGKTEDTACLLLFDDSPMSGHAVAVFRYSKYNKVYFYDPNFGVYIWRGEDKDVYNDIRDHLLKSLKKKYILSAGLFIKSK